MFSFMGHFRSAVVSVLFIMLFIGALMMLYTLHVCMNSIMLHTHRDHLYVSQLCVQRSVSMAAVCLLTPASVSPDGVDWTVRVVSALNS